MKDILHKMSLLMFFIYTTTVFTFSYNKDLNYISQLAFIIFLGAVFFYIALRGSLITSPGIYMQGVFLALIVLSYYWIMTDVTSFNRIRTIFLLILLMTIIINTIIDEKKLEIAIKMVFFAGIAMCIYSLVFYGFEGTINSLAGEDAVRLGYEISQENIFGMITAITAIIGIYYAYYKGQGFYYILTIIPVVFGFASGSRKVILILMLVVIILVFSKRGRSTSTTILITLFSVVAISMLISYLISLDLYIFERFELFLRLFEGDGATADGSSITRLNMIKYGLKWFLDKPLLGYGTDQYAVLYAKAYGAYRYSHCNFIEVLVNHGLIGFFAYYSLYIYMFSYIIKAIRKKVDNAILMLLFMAAFLVLNMFTVVLYEKTVFILYGLILSYIGINKKKILGTDIKNDL